MADITGTTASFNVWSACINRIRTTYTGSRIHIHPKSVLHNCQRISNNEACCAAETTAYLAGPETKRYRAATHILSVVNNGFNKPSNIFNAVNG